MKSINLVKRLLVGLMLAVFVCLSLPIDTALAAKEDYGTWNLDVQFINGSKDLSEAEVRSKIINGIQKAEAIYQRRPKLKVNYEIVTQSRKDGRDLSNLVFDSNAAYAKYMDKNFDNVAVTKTEGHLTVLITDRLCVGTEDGETKCLGGKAFFPHWVNPFSKKRGVVLKSTALNSYTFAHELGHVFGLKHTFEPYIGANLQCNKEYKPKGRPGGECNSCANGKILYNVNGDPSKCDGPTNVMDYCSSDKGKEFITPCQEQRAVNQRYHYMTNDGETNYFDLKGLVGEPICKSDSDCDNGRYCDKGTATVGRNQCKPLKALGQSCSRGGECATDRCSALKCAVAHECKVDRDCGPNGICKLGPLGVGRNECIDTAEPTCPSGWRYEIRNPPLNRDRCNRTTTQTAALKCRLLATDKAKNWTGPHAQRGADECRSKKGKKPKGVKCPTGYTYNQRSGADTCTKTVTDHQTPTCPSDWDYKSQTGKDICQRK